MTHTYSRGCFKLIFRKCLPIHLLLPYAREYTRTRAHVDVLYRDRPPSRASAPSNDTDTRTHPSPSRPPRSVSRCGYSPLPFSFSSVSALSRPVPFVFPHFPPTLHPSVSSSVAPLVYLSFSHSDCSLLYFFPFNLPATSCPF